LQNGANGNIPSKNQPIERDKLHECVMLPPIRSPGLYLNIVPVSLISMLQPANQFDAQAEI
jgi:hypothetical protein